MFRRKCRPVIIIPFRIAIKYTRWEMGSFDFAFIFIDAPRLALRISNGVAIGMLFLSGYALGRMSGQHPWMLGLSMVIVGVALTGAAILLGG